MEDLSQEDHKSEGQEEKKELPTENKDEKSPSENSKLEDSKIGMEPRATPVENRTLKNQLIRLKRSSQDEDILLKVGEKKTCSNNLKTENNSGDPVTPGPDSTAMKKPKLEIDSTSPLLEPQEIFELEPIAASECGSNKLKPHISLLQEFLTKRGVIPTYEFFQNEGPLNSPTSISCSVTVGDTVVKGMGRSKKLAKQAAAKLMYDKLAGSTTFGTPVTPTSSSKLSVEIEDPEEISGETVDNPIGRLQELCLTRKWPPPDYAVEMKEGLPHIRLFHMSCTVNGHKETGSGHSKKIAKKKAAEKLWRKFNSMYNNLNTPPPTPDGRQESDTAIITPDRHLQAESPIDRLNNLYINDPPIYNYTSLSKDGLEMHICTITAGNKSGVGQYFSKKGAQYEAAVDLLKKLGLSVPNDLYIDNEDGMDAMQTETTAFEGSKTTEGIENANQSHVPQKSSLLFLCHDYNPLKNMREKNILKPLRRDMFTNPISYINQLCTKHNVTLPVFEISEVLQTKPQKYKAIITLNGLNFTGIGISKREAKYMAARRIVDQVYRMYYK